MIFFVVGLHSLQSDCGDVLDLLLAQQGRRARQVQGQLPGCCPSPINGLIGRLVGELNALLVDWKIDWFIGRLFRHGTIDWLIRQLFWN